MSQGDRARIELIVGDAEMEGFRRLSGDPNPLHTDDGFARARGFAGRVVYGGLLVAAVSRLLGGELPGPGCVWRSLTLSFRGPLYVGEEAVVEARVVHLSEAIGAYKLAIEIHVGDRLVAQGSADASRIDAKT